MALHNSTEYIKCLCLRSGPEWLTKERTVLVKNRGTLEEERRVTVVLVIIGALGQISKDRKVGSRLRFVSHVV